VVMSQKLTSHCGTLLGGGIIDSVVTFRYSPHAPPGRCLGFKCKQELISRLDSRTLCPVSGLALLVFSNKIKNSISNITDIKSGLGNITVIENGTVR